MSGDSAGLPSIAFVIDWFPGDGSCVSYQWMIRRGDGGDTGDLLPMYIAWLTGEIGFEPSERFMPSRHAAAVREFNAEHMLKIRDAGPGDQR